ncbi:hypothetical protein SAY87_011978 [Trapa incisa]|uniref:NAB domain-containing protein n=1 Tax=Trapa incisa TaxID=236973 RepID=A0AAN7GK40_9MYRT|nr:hypothetical protein SAY87_011978 [Trapa incisa]
MTTQTATSSTNSWRWASRIRTKQSKWLNQSLQDMEGNVNSMLNIIDHDGDSFARRAEMYYRKRPELVAFVKESYKTYHSLAERYDSLSKELQNANHKIAVAFPEEVQFDEDDDVEEEAEDIISRKFDCFPEKSGIPKVSHVLEKDSKCAALRDAQRSQIPSNAQTLEVPSSGISKEALEEKDRLQKEIMSLQKENESLKSAYERENQKYLEMERQIMELQQKVGCLQDDVSIVTEDNETRMSTAATALKSCQESLINLQERYQQSQEEVRTEDKKIHEAYEEFKALSGVSVSREVGQAKYNEEKNSSGRDNEEKEREENDCKVTVIELAENLDNLVDMIVNLESGASSQATDIRRLRSEVAILQAHDALKEEKNSTVNSSEKVHEKLKELEEEVERMKNLKQHIALQCQSLLTHFVEAAGDISNLSEKLESLDLDEEIEMEGHLKEARAESYEKHDDQEIRRHQDTHVHEGDMREEEESKEDDVQTFQDGIKSRQQEHSALSGPNSDFDALSEKPHELVPPYKEEKHDLFDRVPETTNQEFSEGGEEDDQPNWKKLFLNGLDDRERMLLDEYTSVLRSYKDVKNKLRELEKKNQDGLLELSMEARGENVKKEEELGSFRQRLGDAPSMIATDEPNDDIMPTALGRQPLYKLLFLHNDGFPRTIKYNDGGKALAIPSIKEKLRVEIDELLEENLKFWLRFSTSIHKIKKFQIKFQGLRGEIVMLKDAQKHNECNANAISRIWATQKHLKEMQAEVNLWIENNELMNEQLRSRSSTLSCILAEISSVLEVDPKLGGDDIITKKQVTTFQTEVLNMREENQKIECELRGGLHCAKKLQTKIGKTLTKLDKDLGILASKKQKTNQAKSNNSSSRYRISFRSLLFGAKQKKQKPSKFTCASPVLQKQQSEMRLTGLPT